MSFVGLRREVDVELKIGEILKRFRGQKFNGVAITDVVHQYEVSCCGMGARRADIAVLAEGGRPLLIIETKKKYESSGRVARRFVASSDEVLGQVFAYAAMLKRAGVYVPFVATANDAQIVVFKVPEDIDGHVNWGAVEERNYAMVLPKLYLYEVLRKKYLIWHVRIKFSEDFFRELLEELAAVYAGSRSVEEVKQEPHWILIEDLRGFVDLLAPRIEEAIAPGGRLREDLAREVEEYAKRRGYRPSPAQLAREMAYVLMNKIVFYKVLERYYDLERLAPLYREGAARTVSEYLAKLRGLFEKAVEVTGDFEPIFKAGIYDKVDIPEDEEVLAALDWLIDLVESYRVEEFGDIVGYVYEELIPAEERHELGQFYTPRPIAELIVRWAVRSPDDRVLDPGCGSGTFLVEAYRRLAELKLKRPFRDVKYVRSDVHRQILDQLVGVDVNEFPAHLTAVNLAMRDPRVPSSNIRVVVADFFLVKPGQERLVGYRVKTAEGEREVKAVFKDFDAVVGNPPYTRWTEVPGETQDEVLRAYRKTLSKYGLTPRVERGVEPGIYVYWMIHATGFLREGGRLGMIISDSWLQADYGVGFFRFLLDHYKVHAVIDISARVFPVPLVGACVVLLEKSSNAAERKSNPVAFIYLDLTRGKIEVDDVLKIVEERGKLLGSAKTIEFPSGAKALVRVYKQEDLYNYEGRLINLLFNADYVLDRLKRSPYITKLSAYFEPSFGNIKYLYLASKGAVKGVRNVGGEEFFYLTEEGANSYGIPKEYLYPLLPSSEHMKFFTFAEGDWKKIRYGGGECYLFLAHKPRSELPESVRRYIDLGEKDADKGGIALSKGKNRGKAVAASAASQARKEHREYFYDWYDLGGVLEAPIYVARGARYWVRFALSKFNCALDDRVLALIPRQGVAFDEVELKALLAFLNSSFSQLQAEIKGRVAGGVALLELDVKPLSEFLVLDVKKLPRDVVERLASLFDKLEGEARRLGGADTAENVFGSELARELTGRGAGRGVQGLFNTAIREIDYEVARVLGLEDAVEYARALVLDLAKRRLGRAGEARPEVLRGSAEHVEPERPKREKRGRGEPPTARLDEFMRG